MPAEAVSGDVRPEVPGELNGEVSDAARPRVHRNPQPRTHPAASSGCHAVGAAGGTTAACAENRRCGLGATAVRAGRPTPVRHRRAATDRPGEPPISGTGATANPARRPHDAYGDNRRDPASATPQRSGSRQAAHPSGPACGNRLAVNILPDNLKRRDPR
ncbi:hypothetical protein SCWH03_55460 [Streptomyces pacificus]|uniref:Uncharacterized protein n=1 Tax=Streptomyces pacificus TaxID=2705029 RepID=A0A6A0B428_9ACTN|nr:hypothetical protein SCWH03_55460 [Streptomyces pacificus]